MEQAWCVKDLDEIKYLQIYSPTTFNQIIHKAAATTPNHKARTAQIH
jgi:hypothetical protein